MTTSLSRLHHNYLTVTTTSQLPHDYIMTTSLLRLHHNYLTVTTTARLPHNYLTTTSLSRLHHNYLTTTSHVGWCGLQEGLLSSLTQLESITLSRNAFTSYPSGGPSQFCSALVSGAAWWFDRCAARSQIR